jgi:mono/diheme cytochrome c family protein
VRAQVQGVVHCRAGDDRAGVPMVAWKDDLSDDQVRDLVAYIQTLSR